MAETVILRFDSRTKRDEAGRKIAQKINQLCANPEIISEFHELIDESTLGGHDVENEYISFAQMCEDLRHMPRISPACIDASSRYSERMKAMEKADYGRAGVQPNPLRLTGVLQALEREFSNSTYN